MAGELIDPREYAYGPPVAVPRRNAVDWTGQPGGVRSDYWHKGLPSVVVSRNHSQFPGIRFFPADGVGSGIALTECEYTEGIAFPGQSIFEQLPARLQHIKAGNLVITWPGYEQLKWKETVVFVHRNGSPLSVAHMAAQIACLWRQFYEDHHLHFNGDGIRLGPTRVTYHHLRLHQIYSHDGRCWQVEVSYVKPR
ncbi:hypothetical protein Hypma_004347 [Hypsizygus marmoreus]|uniref:Uncharacterized protein n=1 Tax=Hypsizygus marmoreus TaxID=39966 RepID=A0A369K6C5_HYPMA|nr:hypothetical protein Hypma_004347 [Hypsizygus marmoreus]